MPDHTMEGAQPLRTRATLFRDSTVIFPHRRFDSSWDAMHAHFRSEAPLTRPAPAGRRGGLEDTGRR